MAYPPADLVAAGWPARELTHNGLNAATGGIWRVRRPDGDAVLKIATPVRRDAPTHWGTSTDPGHWNYWRREVLAYRRGFAERAFAEGGIRPPALLGSEDRADGSSTLWLEFVDGTPGVQWSPARFADFAARLATAHGSWLGRPALDNGLAHEGLAHDWLARDWLRDYTLSRPVTEPVAWDHPLAVAAWPAPLRADLRVLWNRRYEILAATDRLPRTLCHHDVWPMNLVADGSGPVLLDWAFLGPGPIGEDAANLVLDACFDGLIDTDLLADVASAVLESYCRGLADHVDRATTEYAIMLTGAAKYTWLAPRMLTQAAGDGPGVQFYDGRDAAAMFAGRRRPLELLTRWARQAMP